jgi:orotidine-5'-phosphate decarboxylase
VTEVQRLADEPFGDRLARCVGARASQLVVGLDPDPAALWPRAYEIVASRGAVKDYETRGPAQAGTARGAADAQFSSDEAAMRASFAVAVHCALVLEAVAEHAVAVKLQVACFERLGPPGWAALEETVQRARDHDLLVIADAKRGDIDVTAAAYGQAYFGATPTPYGDVPGLGADALTVNPLLGIDALEPLIRAARDRGGAVFVLVRTSNPGAHDLQDLHLQDGHTVSERLAALVRELGCPGVGSSGLSDVGAVVGATVPDRLEALRGLMPDSVFLLPGVGAQGGQAQDLAPALGKHPASVLISASRAIVQAGAKTGVDPAEAAHEEAARLRKLAWSLAR